MILALSAREPLSVASHACSVPSVWIMQQPDRHSNTLQNASHAAHTAQSCYRPGFRSSRHDAGDQPGRSAAGEPSFWGINQLGYSRCCIPVSLVCISHEQCHAGLRTHAGSPAQCQGGERAAAGVRPRAPAGSRQEGRRAAGTRLRGGATQRCGGVESAMGPSTEGGGYWYNLVRHYSPPRV